jgi:hypothetical protein
MAFNARGTYYGGFQRSRDRADEGLTRALDAKGRADKQARIKKSGERSGLQKLVSAGVRGAAAYYSGGLSEQVGGGAMIDSAMLGTDSQGNAVKNEYGDLAALGSAVYQGSKAQKAQKLAGADAAFDKQYAKRSANVDRLFEHAETAEAKDQAFSAQQSLDAYEQDYSRKKQDLAESGFLGTNLGVKDSEYSKLTSGMSPEELSQIRAKKDNEINASILKGKKESEQRQKNFIDEDRRRQNQTSSTAPVMQKVDPSILSKLQASPPEQQYAQNQMAQHKIMQAEEEARRKKNVLEDERKRAEMMQQGVR